MTFLYKYLAYVGLALGLLISGGLFGWHLGGLQGAKKIAQYQAASETAIEMAKTAASAAQVAADQDSIRQAQALAAQANAAVTAQQTASIALQGEISRLRVQVVEANGKIPAVGKWLATSIPAGALTGLCFPQTQADNCKEP